MGAGDGAGADGEQEGDGGGGAASDCADGTAYVTGLAVIGTETGAERVAGTAVTIAGARLTGVSI